MAINQEIITKTADYVKSEMLGEGSGHDWFHIYRVWNLGKKIGFSEGADRGIVELGCLLHDIADWKFNGGDESVGGEKAAEWLYGLDVDPYIIDQVKEIVSNISFKGANVKNSIRTLEGQCVQDADRLDAIGAIGIARTFTYGGHKGREIYNPKIRPVMASDFETYKNNGLTTINHFYEKLLLVRDMMNTETGRKIAEKKHNFMEHFLEQFYKEWEGNL